MGTFTVPAEIGDPKGERFEEVDALVDTGVPLTTVSESLLKRLGVAPSRHGALELADGRRIDMPIGETRVRVQGMETTTTVVFAEDVAAPLLGAMTLEGLLLGVDPFNWRLVPVAGLLKGQILAPARTGSR